MRLIDADALTKMIEDTDWFSLNNQGELILGAKTGENAWYKAADVFLSINHTPTVESEPVKHGRWKDGKCSECGEETSYTTWGEDIYDYDWEENLNFSHIEYHTEYHETNYCPNCGAKMDGEKIYD